MERIKLSKLALNTGQIEGLPANPRQWTQTDIDHIAESLKETPELFEMRPCIVTPYEGKYVILAGSLRFCGARKNGGKDVPCIVFEGDTRKMQEIVIKDNGSWGAWDFDSLANEWGNVPLCEWGVPAWETEDEDIPSDLDAKAEEKEYQVKITFNDEKDMAVFLDTYKDTLSRNYHCRISSSGGAI